MGFRDIFNRLFDRTAAAPATRFPPRPGRDIDRRPPGSPWAGKPPIDPDEQARSLAEEWIPVVSSNVAAIKWVANESGGVTGVLHVKFRERATKHKHYPARYYAYWPVPHAVYDDMFAAASKGAFVWDHLRDQYEYAEYFP